MLATVSPTFLNSNINLSFMMEFATNSNEFPESKTPTVVSSATIPFTANNSSNDNAREESIRIIQSSVASVGIIANLTVIVVFLHHKKLRRKIPNIFIINQVRVVIMYTYIQEKAIYIYLMAIVIVCPPLRLGLTMVKFSYLLVRHS